MLGVRALFVCRAPAGCSYFFLDARYIYYTRLRLFCYDFGRRLQITRCHYPAALQKVVYRPPNCLVSCPRDLRPGYPDEVPAGTDIRQLASYRLAYQPS